MESAERVLVLTPVKNAGAFLEHYFRSLYHLSYPQHLLSVAFLESDSTDQTYQKLHNKLPELKERFRAVSLFKKDFGFRIPPILSRWTPSLQVKRRTVLAKSRNHLLFRALQDEDWVLWLDVDVIAYPPDIIERLLATGKEIVQPHCLNAETGTTFDLNAWRDKGRLHMDDLRSEGDLVRLHAVGGAMLLLKADVHREGLIFPPFLYGKKSPLIRKNNLMVSVREVRRMLRGDSLGEIETEGLGIMAHDLGYECWGMPNLEIQHWNG
jgi:glycosyltransferase involved in cell wall biosynthesis